MEGAGGTMDPGDEAATRDWISEYGVDSCRKYVAGFLEQTYTVSQIRYRVDLESGRWNRSGQECTKMKQVDSAVCESPKLLSFDKVWDKSKPSKQWCMHVGHFCSAGAARGSLYSRSAGASHQAPDLAHAFTAVLVSR